MIAASTAAWSLVGAWTARPASLKATTPITTLRGWRSTKSWAATLAASMRVGFRSSAAMLPETSKARMTVPSSRGRETTPCGRARAMVMTAKPARKSAAGNRRRRPPGRRTTPRARPRPPCAAARRRRLRSRAPESQTPAGIRARRRSMAGQMKVTGYLLRRRRRSVAMRTMARTRSSSVDRETASTPARANAPLTTTSRWAAASWKRRRNCRSWVST